MYESDTKVSDSDKGQRRSPSLWISCYLFLVKVNYFDVRKVSITILTAMFV